MRSIRIALMALVLAGGCFSRDEGPPKEPSPACCNAAQEPGTNGNPICVEGASCCADGTWSCNNVDGSPSCAACE